MALAHLRAVAQSALLVWASSVWGNAIPAAPSARDCHPGLAAGGGAAGRRRRAGLSRPGRRGGPDPVRDPASSASVNAAPTLRLTDAIDCAGFFRSVARLAADASAAHLGTEPPTWQTVPPPAVGLRVSQL